MKVKKLTIDLDQTRLVDITFEIKRSLALIGQSGSGKSLTLKALLGMLPSSMKMNLESDFVLTTGKRVAFIPQNPFTALSPLTKIAKQFFVDSNRVEKLFEEVGLKKELLERFPPELSGGQLQRVVIAMALSNRPKLLLLDEPTTALDPQTRIVIIDLLKKLQKKENFLMLFVSHDIASAQKLCEDICVLKEGRVIESGKMKEIIINPQMDYTRALIEANFANREFRK